MSECQFTARVQSFVTKELCGKTFVTFWGLDASSLAFYVPRAHKNQQYVAFLKQPGKAKMKGACEIGNGLCDKIILSHSFD